MHFPKFSRRDQKTTNLVYFETVSPIILAALWAMSIAWTISVLLWTITIINFNPALESLLTKDDFNFTNFLIIRVMRCSTKGDSHCCFRKTVSNNYFQKFLLINLPSTCSNWLENFSFTHFPTNTPRGFHVETTWKQSFPRRFNVESTWCVCRVYSLSLQKELVIDPFVECSERVFLVNFISS